MAAGKVRDKLARIAARRLEAQPEDIELLAGDELGELLEIALENGRVDLIRHAPRG